MRRWSWEVNPRLLPNLQNDSTSKPTDQSNQGGGEDWKPNQQGPEQHREDGINTFKPAHPVKDAEEDAEKIKEALEGVGAQVEIK